MNNEKYLKLKEIYPDFIYEGYTYTNDETTLKITYNFKVNNLTEFHPTWTFSKLINKSVDKEKLDELIFSLGMVEVISYWKATCSKNLIIKEKDLTEEQKKWWIKLYRLGLGEFFYINGISNQKDFINIKSNTINTSPLKQESNYRSANVLVPIGGGKDSIVTLESLKEKKECYPYIINPRKTTLDTVEVAGLTDKLVTAKRTIDSNLLELNKEGYLNGHTPFSAIVAFSSLIAAYLNDLSNIALSNEDSANESTVKDSDINHQYSKSFEFEMDFVNYEKEYLKTGIKYFSYLRPLAEIQIAKLFAQHEKYHHIFKSCNIGSKTDSWCSNCSKCLFVYIILLPFIKEEKLINIFSKNMLEEKNLLEDFKKLTGQLEEKPFECVGSIEEVHTAMQIYIEQKGINNLPYLAKNFYQQFSVDKNKANKFNQHFNVENNIPKDFLEILRGDL